MSVSRRELLLSVLALLPGRRGWSQQQPLPGQGAEGSLRDPASAGPSLAPVTARDNDEGVKAIEHRLRCTCGCNLDIYTCRTTDFTCGTSPRLHREVLALQDEGKNADEIIDAFVAKYGEQILMAPKPVGFNIAGYVVPGVALLLGGATLTLLLRRRMRVARVASDAAPGIAPGDGPSAPAEELARLDRELAELEHE
jgi:cytochrome c-type biogenesis protein CcmH/NrfF